MKKSVWKLIFALCMMVTLSVSTINSYRIYAAPSISGDELIPEIKSSMLYVDEETDCISKITMGTTVGTFLSYIDNTEEVVVCKGYKVLSNQETLATGMYARVFNGDILVKEYTVIVTGDTNGDAKINITDMIAVKAGVLKKSNLVGAYAKACDVNGDGKINITDFIKIKGVTLKKDTITGVAAQ